MARTLFLHLLPSLERCFAPGNPGKAPLFQGTGQGNLEDGGHRPGPHLAAPAAPRPWPFSCASAPDEHRAPQPRRSSERAGFSTLRPDQGSRSPPRHSLLLPPPRLPRAFLLRLVLFSLFALPPCLFCCVVPPLGSFKNHFFRQKRPESRTRRSKPKASRRTHSQPTPPPPPPHTHTYPGRGPRVDLWDFSAPERGSQFLTWPEFFVTFHPFISAPSFLPITLPTGASSPGRLGQAGHWGLSTFHS